MEIESTYQLVISTPIFEGPLEDLLKLAGRGDVDLLELRVGEITAEFERRLAEEADANPDEIAEFLTICARLLLLKSRRLLGLGADEEVVEEEEATLEIWEQELQERLSEYRQLKEMAGKLLREMGGEPAEFPTPPRPLPSEPEPEEVEPDLLVRAFQDLLSRIPPRPLQVTGERWTLEDKVDLLSKRLESGAIDLVETLLACQDRLEAVITFVAVLELLRKGNVQVRQEEAFGKVLVEPKG